MNESECNNNSLNINYSFVNKSSYFPKCSMNNSSLSCSQRLHCTVFIYGVRWELARGSYTSRPSLNSFRVGTKYVALPYVPH